PRLKEPSASDEEAALMVSGERRPFYPGSWPGLTFLFLFVSRQKEKPLFPLYFFLDEKVPKNQASFFILDSTNLDFATPPNSSSYRRTQTVGASQPRPQNLR
ncbi:MAG: hypothetical protein ACE5FF_14800, partial [Saprospiraceae bacterium]